MKTVNDLADAINHAKTQDLYHAVRCGAIEAGDLHKGLRYGWSDALFNRIVKRLKRNLGKDEKTV